MNPAEMPFLKAQLESFLCDPSSHRPHRSLARALRPLSGGPCVIVASSGILTGGASAFYARELAAKALLAMLIDCPRPSECLEVDAEQRARRNLTRRP